MSLSKLVSACKKHGEWVIRSPAFRDFRAGLGLMGGFIGAQAAPVLAFQALRLIRVARSQGQHWSKEQVAQIARRRLAAIQAARAHGNITLAKRWIAAGLIMYIGSCEKRPPEENPSISTEELIDHLSDLDFLRRLTSATVVCSGCNYNGSDRTKGLFSHHKYCHCPTSEEASIAMYKEFQEWEYVTETKDLVIWRKPLEPNSDQYMYKVFGYYLDITPQAFLETQLELDGRLLWDDTTARINLIEENQALRMETIYWEVEWPKFMSNRDYVFVRRHHFDGKDTSVVIMSRATRHPKAPPVKGIVRVDEYWSVMQISACSGKFGQPGVEYGLTYYDNPGVTLPGWVKSWVAADAVPAYLNKSRDAARRYRNHP